MLHVHRSERADALGDALAAILLDPPEDPLTPELVSVPTRGIERWLAQRLSGWLGAAPDRSDGICANVQFPSPGRLFGEVMALAMGGEDRPDPWAAERAVWPLLEVVDGCLEEPWLCDLARHLRGSGDDDDPVRRYGVVRHLAGLFERYDLERPEMIRAWANGVATSKPDGEWQAELWRRLRSAIGQAAPAERLPAVCERIRRDPAQLGLPARLGVFGLTRLARRHAELLGAVADGRAVHLFVLHPSPALWQSVARMRTRAPARRRSEDPTSAAPANRLTRSWGRDARELQLVLAGLGDPASQHHPPQGRVETVPSLLARLQADIRDDRRPPGPPLAGEADRRLALGPRDLSIQIHACHGRARQVEVLREAILHRLASDPTLEPRDVIVMCPDIETFAPLIQATFGTATAGLAGPQASEPAANQEAEPAGTPVGTLDASPPDLHVRLADRALRQTNPLFGVVLALLGLADGRMTASEVLDLADREPVRRRFGFDDDDLARLRDWVGESGVRWGLDAAHRQPFKLGALGANTWRAGLDRILLGVTMTEEDRRLPLGVLPLDDVDSGAIELAGRLAELVERLALTTEELRQAKPLGEWMRTVVELADAFAATTEREAWQRSELARVLADAVAEAEGESGPRSLTVELGDVRALLAERLRGRPTRANFRTGHLTICTLVPMRSVPHRVVCVLGLDGGEFPRRTPRDGDDLLLADPQIGDRDPRSEDRQMLLDALLAATETVLVTYTGSDERTNQPRPPAVPVGELLDVIDQTAAAAAGSVRDQVLRRHPLQPFDPRNFTAGDVRPEGPWGFDRVALAGAEALRAGQRPPEPFLPGPLPAREAGTVELARLIAFVQHPARAFLRDRLGLALGRAGDEVADGFSVELDGLGEWGVGQRVLEGVLQGAPMERCLQAEVARGGLPPGRLAAPVLNRVRTAVEQLVAVLPDDPGAPLSMHVSLELPDGRALAGTVPGVCGRTIRTVSYSRVRPRERLAGWVRLLALSAAHPAQPYESVVIGRARPGAEDAAVTRATARLSELEPERRRGAALEQLAGLVELYDRGMREPLPLFCETSAAYARAAASGWDARAAARNAWETTFDWDKEDRDEAHLRVFGRQVAIDELLEQAPRVDEEGPDWRAEEPSRMGRYARRLWDGLLAREEILDL